MVGGVSVAMGRITEVATRRRLLTGLLLSRLPRRPASHHLRSSSPCFVPCSRPSPASAPTRPSWTSPATTSPTSTPSATRAARPSSRTRCPRSSGPVARPAADRGGTNPAQVGLGVKVAATTTNWTQGATQTTGRSTDFMIEGDGFFVTRSGTEEPLHPRRVVRLRRRRQARHPQRRRSCRAGWPTRPASSTPTARSATCRCPTARSSTRSRRRPARSRATSPPGAADRRRRSRPASRCTTARASSQKVFYNFTKAAAADTWSARHQARERHEPWSPAPRSRSTPPAR